MEIKEILTMQKQVKAKLMSAVALLLVSAILLSTSTYAWFVLSTAPEVSEMKTTAGANGALEIALQSTGNLSDIQHGVGDSSVNTGNSLKESNNTWGNVVDLSGNTYGLDRIALSPARLQLKNGNVMGEALGVPQFGEDGRITEIVSDADHVAQFFYTGSTFESVTTGGKGVRVYADQGQINKTAESHEYQLSRRELITQTRSQVQRLRAKLNSDLLAAFADETNAAGLVTILDHTVNGIFADANYDVATYGVDDYTTSKAFILTFYGMVGDAVKSVRQSLLAVAAADLTNYPADGEALSELYASFHTLELIPSGIPGDPTPNVYAIAETNRGKLDPSADKALYNAYSQVMKVAQAADAVRDRVTDAKTIIDSIDVDALTEECTKKDPNVTAERTKLNNVMLALFSPTGIYVVKLQDGVESGYRPLLEEMNADPKYYLWNKNPIPTPNSRFYTGSGSGIFSDIAVMVGDFESGELYGTVKKPSGRFTIDAHYATEVRATSAASGDYNTNFGYDPKNNTGCLQQIYDATDGLNVSGSVTYAVQTVKAVSAYGYAVDLAFQASENRNLLLQQEAVDRVTGEVATDAADRLPSNQTTQGGGSTMEFTLYENAAEDLGGALTEDLIKARAENLISRLRVVFYNPDGGNIYGAAKAANIEVTNPAWDGGSGARATTVRAQLTLCSIDKTSSILVVGEPMQQQTLVGLQKDNPAGMTALVYLDGDAAQSGDFTADKAISMSGSINLQFSVDGDALTPMTYTDYTVPQDGVGA